jgi:hypothetical protein
MFEILRTSWLMDFMGLVAIVGILLWSANIMLRPPWKERTRALGMIMASIGAVGLSFGITAGLQFQSLEAVPEPVIYGNGDKSNLGQQEGRLAWKNAANGTWYEIAWWKGAESRVTETFQIPSRTWMVSWRTKVVGNHKPGNLSISVHRADGKTVGVMAEAVGADENRVILQGAGNYYLAIRATQPYRVVVKARGGP